MRASPTVSSWRPCGLRTWAAAGPGCACSLLWTALRAGTPGWPAAWRPASTTVTRNCRGWSTMALSEHPARRHQQIGGLFTERVLGARDWDVPSPVAGWAARDVVRHLTEWFPPFLSAGAGIQLPGGPSVDEDPVSAWRAQCGAGHAGRPGHPGPAARQPPHRRASARPRNRPVLHL